MGVFTRYETITTPRGGIDITAPAAVFKKIRNAGYHITTGCNGRYPMVYEYLPENHGKRYVASLAYFISDRICGYKDGNPCNLHKSNLIYL